MRTFSSSLEGYAAALSRVLPPIMLGVLPLAIFAWWVVSNEQGDILAFDFHHELYPESKTVLEGKNPFPPSDADLSDGTNNIWPIAAALLVAPLTLFSSGVADVLMTALVIASFAGALLVIGVRDYRVFGAAAMWAPVLSATQTGNLTMPLCLLAAIVWRYRDGRWIPGVALGAALSLKFFLWPLVIWLAALRRRQAVVLAGVFAGASLLLIIPFESLIDYARLLVSLGDTFDEGGYTPYGFLVDAGLPQTAAHAANYTVGAALVLSAWRWKSFALAIGAALVLSPIVWLHFFAVLALPLAAVSPRFSWPWLFPILMVLAPGTSNGEAWQSGVLLLIAATVLAFATIREQGLASPLRPPRPLADGRA